MSIHHSFSLVAASVTVLLALTACKDPVTPETNGLLHVELSSDTNGVAIDASVDEVWVRIDTVQANHESAGWAEISTERLDVDLLADDASALIASGEVWTGAYGRIYLGIVDSWIIVDGVEADLAFAGNFQSSDPFPNGLYVTESLFVVEDSTTTLSVNWDLAANLSQNGSGEWSLGSTATATVDIVE